MTDAPKDPGFWVNHVTGSKGVFGHLKQNSFGETVKQNFAGDWKAGSKGMVFGRTVGTGVGLAMAAHAFKGVDSNGEDRSALVRMGEFVLGTGIAAASLAGRRV